MKYSVEVENVIKKIGNNLIIDDVSFKLERGKIYGLVGANGSGKSTILKIIIGLYKSKGKIIVNGFNIRTNYEEALRGVGGIIDYVSFYDHLTARENLRYFALLYDAPISRVDEIMEMVRLDKKDRKVVKKYSLGMKQRLGIAISLLKDPSVLILDEPTNGLDPKGIVELRELLLSFREKTIIISSHIISEVEKIAHEVIFINNKKIYQKTIKDNSHKASIKFKLGDYERASKVLNVPLMSEEKSILMTDEEVSKSIEILSKEKIPIYRVSNDNSLENVILSLMEGEDND